tara:strand:+ start:756 stop:1682 length:927 start_codon:yes stop_codon:yes gene_type:complete
MANLEDIIVGSLRPSAEEVIHVGPIAEACQDLLDQAYLFPTEVCPWKDEYWDATLEGSSEIGRQGFDETKFLQRYPDGKIPNRVRKARTKFLWRSTQKLAVMRKFVYTANLHSVERQALQMPMVSAWGVIAAHISLGTYNSVLLQDQRALANRKSLLGLPLNIVGTGKTSSQRAMADLLKQHTNPSIPDRLYNEVDSAFTRNEKQYYVRVEGRKLTSKLAILQRGITVAQNILDKTTLASALWDQWVNVFDHPEWFIRFLMDENNRQTMRVPTMYAAQEELRKTTSYLDMPVDDCAKDGLLKAQAKFA